MQQNINPDKASQIREKLQQDIVDLITKKLESGDMKEDRAKAIAKMALEKLPEGIAYEELMKVVPTLDDQFEELTAIIFPIIKNYQMKVEKKVKDRIAMLMEQKKYGDALKLAKQAIEFEKKLI